MSYHPPRIPEFTTAYPCFINPATNKPALVFHMRYTTTGSNARAVQILDAIQAKWFPGKHKDGTWIPLHDGDSYAAAEWLSIVLPLTAKVEFDFDQYDTPELRGFEFFCNWLVEDVFLHDRAWDEINADPVRIAAIWEVFEGVGTLVQKEWRLAFSAAQTKYPARAEIRAMTPQQEEELKESDPDFLVEDSLPAESFDSEQ